MGKIINTTKKIIKTVTNRFNNRTNLSGNTYTSMSPEDIKIEKESMGVFMKNYADRYKTFPKVDETNYNTPYGKDWQGVYNQVKTTREKKKYSAK